MFRNSRLCSGLLAFAIIVALVVSAPIVNSVAAYKLPNRFIHACGRYNGESYTNSLEALESTLKHKVKAVEVDLNFTSDGYLIGAHYSSGSYAYVQSLSKYTILTAEVLLEKLAAKEDIYLIGDTKTANARKVYKKLVDICIENGYDSMLDRIVPQIYSEEDYEAISKVYDFKEYIFTLYRIAGKNTAKYKKVALFCKKNHIKTVTIPKAYVKKSVCKIFKKQGIKVFTHTVNSKKQVKKYKKMGVYGVYTDYTSV